jgi:LmbE family N-acetylglucosaminyl deacetylase
MRMKLDSVDSIGRSYPHVYISPHMDDAVLSCGGRIAMQVSRGEGVLVVAVFSEIGGTRAVSSMPGIPPGGLREMQDEDETALGCLEVDHLRLNYRDGAFRQRFPLLRYGLHLRAEERFAGIFGAIRTDIERICSAAACRNLYLPLGIGQHIDHHLAFRIGFHLKRNPANPLAVSFYEDIPYALIPHALDYRLRAIGLAAFSNSHERPSIREKIMAIHRSVRDLTTLTRDRFLRKGALLVALTAGIVWIETVARSIRHRGGEGLRPEVVDAAPFFEKKVAAILDYRSQTPLFFKSEEALRRSLRQYSLDIGGSAEQYLERYWKNTGRD